MPGVTVTGVHELLANALVMTGEKERTTDLRGEPLKEKTDDGKNDSRTASYSVFRISEAGPALRYVSYFGYLS